MRLQLFTTSALAAASFLGTGAAAQDDGYITSVSTYTIFQTVERVVQTEYATMSPSSPLSSAAPVDTELPHEPTWSTSMMAPVASASMAPLPHYNGTTPAPAPSGSGVMPSSTVSVVPQVSGNSAARFSSESYAFAAIAGIIGLSML